MASRPVIAIDTLSDPRIDVYTRLKDRDIAAMDGRFIAEGELVVRRLLASTIRPNRCCWRIGALRKSRQSCRRL